MRLCQGTHVIFLPSFFPSPPPTKGEVVKLAPTTFNRLWSVVRIPMSPHTFGTGRVWVMDLVWFAIAPHVPVLSPAASCSLPRSRLASSEMG